MSKQAAVMFRAKSLLVGAAAVMLLVACGGGSSDEFGPECGANASCAPPQFEVNSSSLHASTNTASGQSFEEGQVKIINDSETYRSDLVKYSNENSFPINFELNQILLVDMGQRSSSGYYIDVTSVASTSDSINVEISYIAPPNDGTCGVDDALTNPYLFLLIESILPVNVITEDVFECRPMGISS